MTKPFIPFPLGTVNINVSSSSQSVSLGVGLGITQVRVMNNGTATAWIDFGPSGGTITASNGIPVPAGAIEVLTVPRYQTVPYAYAIAAGSTGKIYFTPGTGI